MKLVICPRTSNINIQECLCILTSFFKMGDVRGTQKMLKGFFFLIIILNLSVLLLFRSYVPQLLSLPSRLLAARSHSSFSMRSSAYLQVSCLISLFPPSGTKVFHFVLFLSLLLQADIVSTDIILLKAFWVPCESSWSSLDKIYSNKCLCNKPFSSVGLCPMLGDAYVHRP